MRRSGDQGGFTLVEVIVAIAMVSAVLAATTVFYVRSLSLGHHYAGREDAVRVATSALEVATGLGGENVLTRRDKAAVAGQTLVTGVDAYLADSVQVWDTDATAGAGATASLPTTAAAVVLNGLTYLQNWYVVKCWRATGTAGACTGSGTGTEFLRVVVAVQWNDVQCPGGTCAYFLATLLNASDDPVFPTAPTAGVTTSPTPSASASATASPSASASASPSATASPSPSPSPSPSASATSGGTAIWANRSSGYTNPAALWLSSSSLTVTGLVHTNADLRIEGSSVTLSPRIEYVSDQYISGATAPTPVQVSASVPTGTRVVADYAPGGTAATAAGTGYYAVAASACASGTWTYAAGAVASTATVVYVPCAVNVTTDVAPLLVATGTITVATSKVTIGSKTSPATTGLLSGSTSTSAITISGSYATVYGTVQALSGGVALLGSYSVFQCGIIGDTVQVGGADITITGTCA
ncbi:prepilin-type N-terminal cleavage/methylation domain-containing protein [Actinoplanes lutulentus]|uniref:Prepilin-type N-terminal cleavage/methylation domain-containing protein n=1 Tax=Actinoplanes lutulentus TaxID=1287878 RepID=A0A327Z7L1_9ACTN|nr:type II secretion system protein [Actinoplanes lutulentus]MBB2943772.1 prepilin-type N-terminal cleavage/methylation domain-containing protein [Actinoplanes lutulentus]RAK29314.1 prepilin-type N-terminal cleavage/methylation domain-containing protein [Actinoplanes lutulentus]